MPKLNGILSDLNSLRYSKNNKKTTQKGDTDQTFEIYHIEELNIWIKLDIRVDSYGDNESICGLTFVKPVKKTAIDYENI